MNGGGGGGAEGDFSGFLDGFEAWGELGGGQVSDVSSWVLQATAMLCGWLRVPPRGEEEAEPTLSGVGVCARSRRPALSMFFAG